MFWQIKRGMGGILNVYCCNDKRDVGGMGFVMYACRSGWGGGVQGLGKYFTNTYKCFQTRVMNGCKRACAVSCSSLKVSSPRAYFLLMFHSWHWQIWFKLCAGSTRCRHTGPPSRGVRAVSHESAQICFSRDLSVWWGFSKRTGGGGGEGGCQMIFEHHTFEWKMCVLVENKKLLDCVTRIVLVRSWVCVMGACRSFLQLAHELRESERWEHNLDVRMYKPMLA